LTTAANHLGVWPTTISELERGIRRNDDLATTYREWLTAALTTNRSITSDQATSRTRTTDATTDLATLEDNPRSSALISFLTQRGANGPR